MNIVLRGFFFLFLTLLCFASHGQIRFEKPKWEKVLAKANKKDKMIFVDAYTSWCGPCKWMEREVFPNKKVGKFYNTHYVNVKIDMEEGDGIMLADLYNITSYPSLLFFSPEGELVHKVIGAHNIEEFLGLGELASSPDFQVFTLKKSFDQGELSVDSHIYLADALNDAGERAREVVDTYLEGLGNWDSSETAEFIFRHTSGDSMDYLLEHIIDNLSFYDSVVGQSEVNQKVQGVIYDKLPEEYDKGDLEKAYRDLFKLNWEQRYLEGLLQEYLNTTLRTTQEEFINTGDLLVSKYNSKDWILLNNMAWAVYSTSSKPEELHSALSWILESINASSEYANHDTAAAIYLKLEMRDKAKKHAETAIQIADDQGLDYASTYKLLEKIEAKN